MAQETRNKARQALAAFVSETKEMREEKLQAIFQKNMDAQTAEQAARKEMEEAEKTGNYTGYADKKLEYDKAVAFHEVTIRAYNQAKSEKPGPADPDKAREVLDAYKAETAELFSAMYAEYAKLHKKCREIQRAAYALQKDFRSNLAVWQAEIDPEAYSFFHEGAVLPEYMAKALINSEDVNTEYVSIFSSSWRMPEPIFDPALYGDHRSEEEKRGLVKIPMR